MRVGIIGLPRAGKTTVFNAVARGLAPVGGFGGASKPNIRSVAVPDPRVDRLSEIYTPKRPPTRLSSTSTSPPRARASARGRVSAGSS